MNNVRDLSMPDERGEADISCRGSDWELVKSTMRKIELGWQMLWDEDDPDFQAILAAYNARAPIALMCLAAANAQGPDADWEIMKFAKTEDLRGATVADVVAKPTYVTRYPTWHA
jgi:hypothetical protein